MHKNRAEFENVFFACAAAICTLLAAAFAILRPQFRGANGRIGYAFDHLAVLLLETAIFLAFVGLLRPFLAKSRRLNARPYWHYCFILATVFCIFWLPVLLDGGFIADDWLLLAAASIRKIVYLHPSLSWYTLDSVDGNFRPLGTVLYVGYMLKTFGLSPVAFLTGNLLVNFAASLVAFFVVRELGYSHVAASAAAILYISRDIAFTLNAWVAALGDGVSILLCGLTTLAILRATKLRGAAAVLCHLLAWTFFVFATLAKQSSFVVPLIVALLLLIRPGDVSFVPMARRLWMAASLFLVYSATVAFVFFHAKKLFNTKDPYPIHLTFSGFVHVFSYATWYFIPDIYRRAPMLPAVAGLAIVLTSALFVLRVPGALGRRPRDVGFAVLAAAASVSLFVVLPSRSAPYYGAMSAFWLSIALGIVLTRFGTVQRDNLAARYSCFIFCLLIAVGFFTIQLKRIGLIPSGGYIAGPFEADQERVEYVEISQLLADSSQKDTLVLADCPESPRYYASMALLADPKITRILVYDSHQRTYLSNDLNGERPKDERSALQDVKAFNWNIPVPASEAINETADAGTLWLTFNQGNLVRLPSAPHNSLR